MCGITNNGQARRVLPDMGYRQGVNGSMDNMIVIKEADQVLSLIDMGYECD